ncbi:MAG: tRNA uracil 4-sulfurtransferase ThiI [Candidatus Micrarchaeia archaeon]
MIDESKESVYDAVVIHYGEIGVKGGNRGRFVWKLYKNVENALEGEEYEKLENGYDRLVLRLSGKSDLESIESRLKQVFGIAWFAPAKIVRNDMDAIIGALLEFSKGLESVKVIAKRSYKKVGFDSKEIVGRFIQAAMKNGVVPDKKSKNLLFANVAKEGCFVTKEKIEGPGGLPVGSSGRAVILLSGGIDSPVSAYFAMKRGLEPVFLHVHAFPNGEEARKDEKIKGIIKVLAERSSEPKAVKTYYAPGHIFLSYAAQERSRYELVLFKRFLYRIAERIAKKEKAGAIVTGDSLGQVASQTLPNLSSSSAGIKLLIIRPLIGFDKNEIIGLAKSIGTYELSIMPYRDVCSISSRSPKTGSDPKSVAKLYKKAELGKAENETIRKTVAYYALE